MKKVLWLGLSLIVFAATQSSRAQDSSDRQTIVLYSPIQYNDGSRSSVDLQRTAYAPLSRFGDVGYGFSRIGDAFDWLQSPLAQNDRTVIRDLGTHAWTDGFNVPWVESLPELKPGEVRQFFVSTNGKDGCSGCPAEVSTSPATLKAILGHMYVIHVLDDRRDFFALFRIEALQRGDNCTIAWKLIPAPQPPQ